MTRLQLAVVGAAAAWALWRVGRAAVRDFREMRRNNREAAEIFRSLIAAPHVCRNWHVPNETWVEYEETIEVGGLRLQRRDVASKVHAQHFQALDDGIDRHPEQPHVRCGRCYGTAFRVRFGNYSVIADCAACGLSDEVYSG